VKFKTRREARSPTSTTPNWGNGGSLRGIEAPRKNGITVNAGTSPETPAQVRER
jgi:hypothetical protein